MTLTVRAPTFRKDRRIPEQFSKDGGNVSPLLKWEGAPPGTLSYALVVEDPDAPKGIFRHWATYNIPPETHRLDEGAGSDGQGMAMLTARNDFGHKHYDGPQPPVGDNPHHYHFRLFALDVPALDVRDGCSAADVLEAARAHSLAEADTVGVFAAS